MIPRHSSVPRPGAAPPPAQAREYFAVSFGSEGSRETDAWLRRLDPSIQRQHVAFRTGEDAAAAALQTRLTSAVVGIRVVLAGPEADVYACRALALTMGAVDEELVLLVTPDGSRRVHCPHCQSTTVTDQPVGEVVVCMGCHRNLVIYHHFSRRTATYLGYMVDAEEPAKEDAA